MNGCSPPRLLGVRPTTIQILPGCLVVVGETAAEARDKRGTARQNRLVQQAKGLIEALVFDLPFRALAFT